MAKMRQNWAVSAASPGDSKVLPIPDLSAFEAVIKGSGDREISTTMAFCTCAECIIERQGTRPSHCSDCAGMKPGTFGMEGMFRQLGIYTREGQKYVLNDSNQVMYYREDRKGKYWKKDQ